METLTKIESSFGVITGDEDCHIVTEKLGLNPVRCRQKGEETVTSFSPTPISALYGIWEISKTTIGEEISFSAHMAYYRGILGNKLKEIKELKEVCNFECVLYVLVTTEYGKAGFDLRDEDLAFINDIANRFTYAALTGDNIST